MSTDATGDEPVDHEPVNHEAENTLVELRDGSKVLVRPVHRDDAPLLEEGFSRLSAESRRLRFLTDKPRLTKTELRYFTHIDHHDHEAIGARDAETGRGLGIARYIRDQEHPEVAEVAVAIVDDWQQRGLASVLLSRLFDRARDEGIRQFTALVAEDNESVAALMQNLGAQVEIVGHEAGAISYVITPAPEGRGAELQHLLRAFGRGELAAPATILEALSRLVPERFHS
jgi:RimJ/RimL family protein N-acetyltransferase